MSIETREKKIGDSIYRVKQLGGRAAFDVQMTLMGALLSSLSSGHGVNLGLLAEDAEGLLVDPSAVLRSLTPAQRESLRKTFADSTKVLAPNEGGTPVAMPLETVYDDHFGGSRATDVWFWLAFCLEVNFGGGFFSEVLARLRAAREARKSASPKAAAGSSSASSPTATG